MYEAMQEAFLSWGDRRYKSNLKDLDDVFQDMITSFYMKALITDVNFINGPSLTAYMYGTWERMLAQKYARKKKWFFLSDKPEQFDQQFDAIPDPILLPQSYETVLGKAFLKISPTCREMLNLALIEQLSTQKIAEIMEYSTIGSARTIRSRCQNDLKEAIKKMLSPDQLEEIIQNL